MMRIVAIVCGVIGLTMVTAGPSWSETLNVSVGSSVDRTFFAAANSDVVFTMRNQGRTPVTACCFYVNRNGTCANAPQQVCFGKNSCGGHVPCISGCTASDFVFDIPAKSKVLPGSNVVQWTAQDGLAALAIPPVNEIPFFGDLLCDIIEENGECPAENPCR